MRIEKIPIWLFLIIYGVSCTVGSVVGCWLVSKISAEAWFRFLMLK